MELFSIRIQRTFQLVSTSISAGLGTLPALFSFKLMPFPTLLAKTVVINRGTACKSSRCISKPATELVMKDR